MKTKDRIIIGGILAVLISAFILLVSEEPATNPAVSRMPAQLSGQVNARPALPAEIVRTYGRSDRMEIGRGFYVDRQGQVFQQVAVLNTGTPNGSTGYTEVYTGQKVRIVNPAPTRNSTEDGTLVVLGVFIAVLAGLRLFSPDWAWQNRRLQAARQGLEVKRTPEWETRNTVRAVVCLSAAVFLIAAALIRLLSR